MRGKSSLDHVLDDISKRKQFLKEYRRYLTEDTLYINNDKDNPEDVIKSTYNKIAQIKELKRKL